MRQQVDEYGDIDEYSAAREAAHYPQETEDEYVCGQATGEMILAGNVAKVAVRSKSLAYDDGLMTTLRTAGKEASFLPCGDFVFIGYQDREV